MKRFLIIAHWVLLPLLLLAAFEKVYRKRLERSPWNWELLQQQIISAGGADFIFFGASRVGAAVQENTFAETLQPVTGVKPRVFSLGTAFTTLGEHYLALRNLVQRHPSALSNCVVLFELTGGVPEPVPFGLEHPSSWTSQWVHPARRALAFPLVRPIDWEKIYSSGHTFEEKVQLAAYSHAQFSHSFINREKLRSGFLAQGQSLVERKTESVWKKNQQARTQLDLADKSGIRRDEAAADVTLASAKQWNERQKQIQKRTDNWSDLIVDDIIDLVQAHGGKVAFFEMPLPSVMSEVYETAIGQENRRSFREYAASRDCVILSPEFKFEDSYFPDHSHLAATYAADYTKAIAQAWIKIRPKNHLKSSSGE
ncbi:MAG: hypothetical protein SFY81_16205 [Verrucomicrobiota bacterium]|nr:hypothetical protein [Verrucomicrobiota bacterium]